MDFSRRSTLDSTAMKNYTVELHELEALAKALDTQKEIAERAFHIHREATRNTQHHLHDPEVCSSESLLTLIGRGTFIIIKITKQNIYSRSQKTQI